MEKRVMQPTTSMNNNNKKKNEMPVTIGCTNKNLYKMRNNFFPRVKLTCACKVGKLLWPKLRGKTSMYNNEKEHNIL